MRRYDIRQLATEKGFTEIFWSLLADYRRDGLNVTQRGVFDELNDYYEQEVGEPRFPSFDAFRVRRDRRVKRANKKIT